MEGVWKYIVAIYRVEKEKKSVVIAFMCEKISKFAPIKHFLKNDLYY